MIQIKFISGIWLVFTIIGFATSQLKSQTRFNPTIIQDSRVEPTSDGTFGFKYRTEDGITHAAQGDPTGYIHGSYSYKDPTGLKVNFNYFAGARNNPTSATAPRNIPAAAPPPQQYYSEPAQYQPNQEYVPRTRPAASYDRPQYVSTDRRHTDSTSSRLNDLYDNKDYQYSR